MIENLLMIGLSNAFVATGMALVVFVVTRKFRHAPLAHLLWFVVLLKLVTPPVWSWSVSIPAPTSTVATSGIVEYAGESSTDHGRQHSSDNQPELSPKHDAKIGEIAVTDVGDVTSSTNKNSAAVGPPVRPVIALDSPSTTRRRGSAQPIPAAPWLTWTYMAAAGWFLGTLIMMAILFVRVYRFRAILRRASEAPADLCQEVASLSKTAGVRSKLDVRVSDACLAPLVFGCGGRVVLLLPTSLLSRLDSDERTTLIAHELAHLRRRDHWTNWFTMLITTLYWWLPIGWFARRQLSRLADLCCDGWAVSWFPDKSVSHTNY